MGARGKRRRSEVHSSSKRADEHFAVCAKAGSCANEGRWHEAAELYEQAVAAGGREVALFSNLGLARLMLGKVSAAEAPLLLATSSAHATPSAFFNLGLLRTAQHRHEPARQAYLEAVNRRPDYFEAWFNLGNVLLSLRQREAAAQAFERAVELRSDDPMASHMLAALRGQARTRAPAEFVRSLFNQYAPTFDENLEQRLQYDAPSQLRELLNHHIAQPLRPGAVLDVGCGTGLAGAAFADLADHLTGVDLSEGMIDQARRKGIYDSLIVADFLDVLRCPGPTFDMFLACDVFIYLGDLGPVFEALGRRAAPNGLALFSTEVAVDAPPEDVAGFHLGPEVRFTHSREHVLRTADQAHWVEVASQPITLRLQRGRPVPGEVFLLRHQP
ncbi:MAG: tetratricopeptide repeat protein [Planctomycetes bacterium]|nr:tetratricopeptide repeat protein [Planctomycetota bacterium]